MRIAILLVLAVLALPATASAASVKIAPRASAVSASGATTLEVANATRHVLAGRARLSVTGRAVASRSVRLPARSVATVRLRLGADALAGLRAANTQRGVASVRVARRGKRAVTARRTLTLRLAAAPAQPPADGPAAPASPAPQPPAAANRWVGRMGGEGAYDDLELTVVDGRMEITKAPIVPVFCFETGGSSGDWTSGELFDAPGPWTIGADAAVEKPGVAVNPLVGRDPRTITYKVTGTTQSADRIEGTLGMIFYAARPDVFSGAMVIVNCAGSQSFEAVPAS